ncbi:TonB-dependent siderophore receptor [Temperatibacter marinus]|uniref:TonB-dependent siderophore receptor n=1 Tax=Temperatibacter marinus TaxID=1456591 RepID=A0AA52EF00_9PROT|nr:TonB-dependent siderophore receptor [Temperatibacter marinus]WND03586.1 TonB-dependent siderophore receptor [Temperatibacter marinus]
MQALPKIILTSLLSTSILSSSVCAHETSTEEKIEEIEVTGKQVSIDKMNAVKTPTPLVDIPQSLSIIDSRQIADQAFSNFGDILRYTPGLSISQGEGHRDAIIIRGIQTTADFFLDGFRDDVQYYRPLYNLEQIEVLRGSNALLFGRGGGGGIINRVTKKANLETDIIGLNASLDSFGAYALTFDYNTEINDNAAFRLNAFYEDMNNHRDFFDGERFAINPKFLFKPSEETDIHLSYEYIDDDRTVDRGVPSQNVDNGPDVPLKGYQETFFGSPEENFTTLQAHILRARVDHEFSEVLRGNIGVQYADYDKWYQNLYSSEEVVVTNGAFSEVELDGYSDATDRENTLVQANLIGEPEFAGFKHTFLLGLEFGSQKTSNSRRDNVFAANGDDQLVIPFSDPLVIPDFSYVSTSRNRSSDVSFLSVYFQDQIDVTDWFKVIGGLRFDRFDIDVTDVIVNSSFSRTDEEVTPRFGAIVKPMENLSAYYSYSETFLPRSGDQFLTLNLDSESTRPQSFKNSELGLKWDMNDRFSLTAALFDLDRESYTSVDPDDASQLIIIEGSVTQGFEIQATGYLSDKWYISVGYSYIDGKVARVDDSGNSGNKTRQTPENMLSIWNRVTLSDAFSIGFGATYQDSYFVREDNSVEVPSYFRVDAAAYYTLNETTRLQLNVENLFDEDYYPDAHSNDNISTGKPLNVKLGIQLSF